MKRKKFAYVTLVTDDYVPGVIALRNSLNRSGSAYDLIVMYTSLEQYNYNLLKDIKGVILKKVDMIENPYSQQGYLKYVFTKLNCFSFFDYNKIVFIDADVIVLKNLDFLFELNGRFASIKDEFLSQNNIVKNKFYGGFFVFEPNYKIFENMMKKLGILDSFDKGDMGFLNEYFKDDVVFLNKNIHRLKEMLFYDKKFDLNKVYSLHFTGIKPWFVEKSLFENLCFDYNLNLLWNKYYLEKDFVVLRNKYFKKKYGGFAYFIMYDLFGFVFGNYRFLKFMARILRKLRLL